MGISYGVGDNVAISTYTGSSGEVVVNTTTNTIHVMDGSTAGGNPLATEDSITTGITGINTNGTSYFNQLSVSGVITATSFVGDGSNLTGISGGGGGSTAGIDTTGTSYFNQLSVSGVSTFQGNVNLGDNDRLRFGDSQDLQIYHTGSDDIISSSGGTLKIAGSRIVINNAANNENQAVFTQNGSVALYYDNSKKFETTGYGVTVFGTTETQQLSVSGVSTFQGNVFLGDNDKINLGASNDLQIYHDGSNSYIDEQGTGDLILRGASDIKLMHPSSGETYAIFNANGASELYYDNSKKFETTTDGIKVNPNVSLGTIAGNSQDLALFETTNGNGSKLRIVEQRDVNGTDWTSAYTRIQKTIDVTNQAYIQFNGDGNDYGMEFGTTADEKFAQFIRNGAVELYYDNSKKFETTSTGVSVTGLLSATTKSFVIDHPTKEGMKLRYGSLEGPENGVYVRGRLKDNNTIELPDYWTGLVDEDTITVNLTPIGTSASLHSVVDIVDNTVVVESANGNINCFYTVFGERKDVKKLEVEY